MHRFTEAMWTEIGDLYRAILELPFNRELAAGTLARQTFLIYMIQDAHYLGAFARALAIVAAKAPIPAGQVKFARSAAEAITVERALHEDYFREFGVTDELYRSHPPSPTCTAYCNFLLAEAYGRPFSVGCAAVLPCFEIYWKVGLELLDRSAASNPFRRWIDTYADEDFGRSVREAQALTDEAYHHASDDDRQAMRAAYLQASRYEWMFWDSAYREERWPI